MLDAQFKEEDILMKYITCLLKITIKDETNVI
jgi:hypothetical protein